jgi:hypothetical protein
MFRISVNGYNPIMVVDQLKSIEPAIRTLESGRYYIDEVNLDPLPSGYISRRWGTGTKRPDGSVMIEPDLWQR